MKGFMVTEMELKQLSLLINQTVGLVSVGSFLAACAVDWLREWQLHDTSGSLEGGLAFLAAAGILLLFGLFQWRQRRSLIEEIKRQAVEISRESIYAGEQVGFITPPAAPPRSKSGS